MRWVERKKPGGSCAAASRRRDADHGLHERLGRGWKVASGLIARRTGSRDEMDPWVQRRVTDAVDLERGRREEPGAL